MAHSISLRPLALLDAPSTKRFRIRDLFGLSRQRRALANLSDAQLRDIGLTEKDARIEANRPVWDVPAHWRE